MKASSSSGLQSSSRKRASRPKSFKAAATTIATIINADAADVDVDAADEASGSRQTTNANKELVQDMRHIGIRDAMFEAYSNAIVNYCRWVYQTFTVRPHEAPTPKFAYHLICRLLRDECFTGEVYFLSFLFCKPNNIY